MKSYIKPPVQIVEKMSIAGRIKNCLRSEADELKIFCLSGEIKAIQDMARYYGMTRGYRVTTQKKSYGVLVIRHEDRERRKRK